MKKERNCEWRRRGEKKREASVERRKRKKKSINAPDNVGMIPNRKG
jgi:hypothetical protein